ncbi:LysR family transcriptional regulator [Spirillospora sp. NPDC052242]
MSRAIRRLERRLGVTLLKCGGGRIAMTPAGETLLAEGTAAHDAVAAAVRRTRRAGTGAGLVLAMKPGDDAGLLPAMLAAHAAVPGAVPVEVAFGFGTQAAMLRDGRADAALLYAPRADLTGLAAEALVTERQVAVLPRAHPPADRDAVPVADAEPTTLVLAWPETSRSRDLAAFVHAVTTAAANAVANAAATVGRDAAAVG